jgi:tetratricopeptide (TPR) repeat protein
VHQSARIFQFPGRQRELFVPAGTLQGFFDLSSPFRSLISAVFLLAAFIAPQSATAHGELLIRIGDATRRIEAATNKLAPLYLARGELYREDQNWPAAASDYDRAAEIDPNLLSVDFCRAKMLDDSGKWDASRAMFDKVLARSPENGEAFLGRARIWIKLHQRENAVADFRKGISLVRNPKPDYFLELAKLLAAEGETNEAVDCLDQGVNKFGPAAPLQLFATELELGRNNNSEAVARLDTVIARAGRKETLLARRGDILLKSGRSDEARKSFEASLAAIKLLPEVLQKASPMQKLQAHIQAALNKEIFPAVSQNSK